MPKKLGPYRVMNLVGSGGLGKVYKGIDERTGKAVAIKVLHEKYVTNKKFLGIFHRELLIMSSLNHKHIVRYLDNAFEPPLCYIVTEFIEGWSLHKCMKTVGRFPPLVALSIIIDLLQGVDHLHLHDKVHADLSSPNVLIEKTGRVLVTDFGLSCETDSEAYKYYMVGTPGYYAPEHISEAGLVPQTDIYCSALILFEMIVGKKLIPVSKDRKKLIAYMKSLSIPHIPCGSPKMDSMIRKLLKDCLHANINKRISSADQMMFRCYEILKRYNIRYARHAIIRYLIDRGLVAGPFKGNEQDIYKHAK